MVPAVSSSTQAQGGYRIVASGMMRGSGGRFGGACYLVFNAGQFIQSFRTEKAAQRFIAAQSGKAVR